MFGKKIYTCSICKKSLSNAAGLKAHKKIHSNKRLSSRCNVSSKTNQTNSAVKVNISQSGIKRFKCYECDQCFINCSLLLEHMRNTK